MKFFYAIFEDDQRDSRQEQPEKIAAMDGPFESVAVALNNALLNCCTGEPGDPVFDSANAFARNGRFECESGGQTAVVAISDNAGCLRTMN